CALREIEERKEKEDALAREGKRLAQIRWAVAAVGAIVLIAGGIVGWLQWDKARQLATKEVTLTGHRQQLEQARANVTAEQAGNAKLKSALVRRQRELEHGRANFLAELSGSRLLRGEINSALRYASLGARIDRDLPSDIVKISPAAAALA